MGVRPGPSANIRSASSFFRRLPAGSDTRASQAAYAVNGLFQAASILLLQLIAVQLVSRRDARALGWIVQLMPIAFVFRIRANQEYAVLAGILLAVLATERSRERPAWAWITALGFVWALLVKGVFGFVVPIACGLWLAAAGWSDRGTCRPAQLRRRRLVSARRSLDWPRPRAARRTDPDDRVRVGLSPRERRFVPRVLHRASPQARCCRRRRDRPCGLQHRLVHGAPGVVRVPVEHRRARCVGRVGGWWARPPGRTPEGIGVRCAASFSRAPRRSS